MRDAPGYRQVARHEPDLPGHGPPGADPLDTRQALVRGHELQVSSLWQYGLWSFQRGGDTKLERFLPKNQHTQRILLNFEDWVNGEMLKIGYYFRK